MENTGTTSSDNSNTNNIKIFIGNNPVYDDKKHDDKITHIRDILSKALQIDNLNFLLGAGCSSYKVVIKDGNENTSKELGISTMIGLFYEFIEKNNFKFLDLTQEKIINELDKNLENLLEYLYSFDLVTSKFGSDKKITFNDVHQKKLAKDITDAISSIKRFIKDAILSKTKSTEVIELYKSFYQKIINKNRKNPINIFTTNYDVYNETALDRLNFLYNNGFSGTVERKFNPMLYKYMYVENMNLNKDVWEPVSYYFNLIKLHGSITWEKHDIEIYENINLKNDNDNKSIDEANKVMIYPSPLKDRSTLMTPYSDLFRFLENSLFLNNSTLIVIGYSFGDDHINRVIYNALANPTFRLIIFGNSDNIKKLIERNDKRITIIYSENIEKSNNNKKENEQNKQQNESKQVQLSDEKKQDNKQDSKENCKNAEQQPIHYFKSIVNDLLPSVNDDILEKDILEQMVKSLLKENKN